MGRDPEVEQLGRALARAGTGHGQVVAVVGEAGVGKSRLYWEFSHSARTQGWLVLESRSVSYGRATSYLPVIDLLISYFQIEAHDEPQRMREKVTNKLQGLDEALQQTFPAFLSLLDLPVEDVTWQALDPPRRRQRTLDAVKRLLLRESQAQPLLLIFEDLHWIDAETQALLDALVESLPTARLLLLVNYRPEYQHGWGSKTYYGQLRIDPLARESAGTLLRTLLGDDASLEGLIPLLIERTDGNPFFLEECVRSLVETGMLRGNRGMYRLATAAPNIQVPATVQTILAARIDRLPPEEKRLLQSAAVIGKDVPFGLIQAIAGLPELDLRRALAHLQAAEFVYETHLFPDLEYTFKHALTHEVAYGSVLQERRRALHAQLVDTIEQLYSGRLAEHVERLAHHAVQGELREKAVYYLRQAGLKAAARSALPEARIWFEHALRTLDRLPENRSTLKQAFDTRLELRPVLVQLGDFRQVLNRLREAEPLAERLNDDRGRSRVCAFMTSSQAMLGELDEALTDGRRAIEIGRCLDDLELRIQGTTHLELAHYLRGEYAQVVELATGNLAALPIEWTNEYFGNASTASVWNRSWLIMSLAQLGKFAEAAPYEVDAVRLAEPTQRAFNIGLAHLAATTRHLLKGDWETARSLTEHAIEVMRAGSVTVLLPELVASSAWALAQLGDETEALIRLEQSERFLDRLAGTGVVGLLGWRCYSLGRACLQLLQLDRAARFVDCAAEASTSQRGDSAHLQYLLGEIATHPDRFDADGGEALYRKALALAEERKMRPLVAHCHRGLSKLYRRTDKRQQAQEHLTTATTMYREMGMRFWLEQAESKELA